MDIYQQILTKYWGFSKFRPIQEDIIKSIGYGNDTLGLMPTGGGKSITFQVPALAKPGLCIVITPLISLMKDQVDKLEKLGIKAKAVYSGMEKNEIKLAIDNCIYGDYKLLYISPERIENEYFKAKIKNAEISFITVDEAHCISQWGYDFRPSYLKIVELREYFPDSPVLALTATATNKVAEDIQEKLKFINKNIIKSGYERKNLIYLVRNVEDKNNYILTVLQKIKGSGIIYVRNRKKTKEIANYLLNHKIPASYYHAGLKTNTRSERQNNWNSGITRIIVATNAFGMGIDKPDVRFVIHYDLPDSVEEYYQEAGRAGRDGKKSYGVLLFNNSDNLSVKQRIRNNFPDIDTIKKVYQALGNYLKVPIGGGKGNAYDFNLATFASNYNLNIRIAYSSLKFLEREGYIELTEDIDNPSRVHFIVNRDDLYKFQVANANLDGFIKLLLRSYTGIFNEYVNINEEILAKRANITRDMVYEFLVMLSKFKIINYIPQKKTPLVVYTEERLDDKNLRISKENYKDRKERYLERLNALLDYASNKTKCRNMILLNYFGEKDTYRCGQCDNCNIRNELGLSEYEFNKILKEIKKKLKETPHLLNELVNSINQPNEKTIKVIQWLLDNDKLKYDKENKLEWH